MKTISPNEIKDNFIELIGKEWMLGRDVLSINLRGTYMGGQRYTPVDVAATMAHPDKAAQYDQSQMFAKQLTQRNKS